MKARCGMPPLRTHTISLSLVADSHEELAAMLYDIALAMQQGTLNSGIANLAGCGGAWTYTAGEGDAPNVTHPALTEDAQIERTIAHELEAPIL